MNIKDGHKDAHPRRSLREELTPGEALDRYNPAVCGRNQLLYTGYRRAGRVPKEVEEEKGEEKEYGAGNGESQHVAKEGQTQGRKNEYEPFLCYRELYQSFLPIQLIMDLSFLPTCSIRCSLSFLFRAL